MRDNVDVVGLFLFYSLLQLIQLIVLWLGVGEREPAFPVTDNFT